MKFKLIIIVALAVLIISTGTVSADENTTHDETLKHDNVSIGGEATFTDLQNTIDLAAPDDNITLEEDYVYNTGFSTDGISITKSVFINGQGHTINARSQSRAFTIAADNVVLKDLSIINSGSGGAVTITGNNVFLDNVTFNGCHSTGNGGAVHSTGKDTLILNSAFIGCDSASGGALYLGNNATVFGSQFINCSSDNDAGAIHINAACIIINCLFDHNIAVEGGDIYLAGSPCNITDCNFTGSHASGNGGAVRTMNVTLTIMDCQFISCVSQQNGGAVYMGPNSSGSIMACDFTGDRAVNGGAVYSMGDYCSITGGIFQECRATDGGAVYANGKANATSSIFQNNHAVSLGGAIYNCMHSDCVFESNTEPEIYFDEEFRENLAMTIDVSGDSFGEDIMVLVHVEPSVSLNATADISGTSDISDAHMVFEIINGTGILYIAGLNAGEYVLTVTVNSTMEYNSCSNSTMFSVMKVQPALEIIADDIYYGDDAAILVNLSDGATGMVELYVNGKMIYLPIIAGKASTVIPGLEAGTYYVTASYAGDLNYNACSNNATFKVMHNTFSQLQTIIDDDTTGEITLDRDYYGEGSEITISKTITINGNGHTLDAKGQSRIFNVQSGTVVLDNLSLVNGNSDSYGGAAYFQSGSTCTVRNCNFTGNTAKDDGGAVYFDLDGEVTNCNFVNNKATTDDSYGGAVCMYSGTVENCNFVNNTATGGDGGAIWICFGTVTNCNFVNNKATTDDSYGGAVCMYSGSVENCNFTNNNAVGGGAVFFLDISNLTNCNFTGNTAKDDGGAVYFYEHGTVTNSTFTANSAKKGGAIYSNGNADTVNSTFIDNSADLGGAIYNCDHEICKFTGNSQPDVYFDEQYRKNVTMSVNVEEIMMGEDLTVIISFDQDITGNVTVNIDGVDMDVPIVNRTGNLLVHGLSAGDHTLTASFNGNFEYRQCNVTMEVTVLKKKASVNIATVNIQFGDVETVNVQLNESIEGIATVEITKRGSYLANGTVMGNNFSMNYTITLINGSAFLSIPDLTVGEYTATVHYPGDENYTEANATINFTVSKRDLNVLVDFSNENKTITFTPQANVAGVSVEIAGNIYEIEANVSTTIDLNDLASGNYTYIITYPGSDAYNPYTSSANITISRLWTDVSITIEANDISVGENLIVTIRFNESVTGNVTLQIASANATSNINYTVSIVDGLVSVMIPDLSLGKYTATAYYPGDDKYTAANATINFTVSKRDLNVLVDFSNEDKTITFTPQANVAGVSVEIAGNIYEIEANVSTTIDLNDLASGNYTYIITYPGGDAYNPYTSSANITISRLPVNVTVNAGNITYGQTQNVTAIVPDGATSMVNFILSRDEQIIANTTSQVVNGVASYEIPQLNAGTYLLRASYLGDSKYEASSFYEKRFKVDPNIDVSPKVKIGDDGKIVIEVGDITGRIAVFVDDEEDGSRSINNKKFTYYLVTEDYSVGYHNLTFEYIGSDLDENVFKKWDSGAQKYLPIKYLINITQRPTETVLDSDSDQMFVVVLEDDDGKLLSNATGNVTFTILDEYANVVAEEVVGVVNGIATLDLSKYKNGNYVIQWSYSGDEKHTPITRQVSLSIIHKASRINAGDVKIIYTQSKWYSVTLYGNDGKPLGNAAVEFLIGNRLISKVNTNANGVAGVSISSNPGTYSLSIKAPGKTVTKKLTVEHIISLKTVKIKRSAKKLVLTATLKKVNGKYLKGKKVTFKFNGKKYSAKTNKKGVAKVTIKKNVLKKLKKGKKVTYQATYLKDTVKKKSKVNK